MKLNFRFSYKDFIYLFPTAAWVNQSIELFKSTSDYFAIYLALLLFAFIPVELYVSSLWAKERSNTVGTIKTAVASLVDGVGVFFLTVLYISYPSIYRASKNQATTEQLALLLIGLGLLLVANGIWNHLGKIRDHDVFASFARSLDEKIQELSDGVSRSVYGFIRNSTSGIRVFNHVAFGYLFPSLGVILSSIAFIPNLLHTKDLFGLGEQHQAQIATVVVLLLSVLLALKILHTALLIYIRDHVDDRNLRYTPQLLEIQCGAMSVVEVGAEAISRVTAFRHNCMTEDLLHNHGGSDLHSYRHFNRQEISYDDWDDTAFHITVRLPSGELIGSIRVNFPRANSLPFLHLLNSGDRRSISILESDIEISRLFVKRNFRGRPSYNVAGTLIFAAAKLISLYATGHTKVYADVLLNGADRLRRETFEKFGFVQLPYQYFDGRYQGKSQIYLLEYSGDFLKSALFLKSKASYDRKVRLNTRSAVRSGKLA